MAVRVLVTGGTFDKEYNELEGTLFFRESHIHEMLSKGRCKIETQIRTLMLVDSLDMTSIDREIIISQCEKSKEESIVITHGTDTMVQTAKLLCKIQNKTIVLTGAMIPYRFGSSDGMFNLGCAIACAQTLPNGVYICMNGKIFPHDNVFKNKVNGIFEKIKHSTS